MLYNYVTVKEVDLIQHYQFPFCSVAIVSSVIFVLM